MRKDILGDIRYLKGVGLKRAALFNKLEISSIEGLLYYFPRRYEDRTVITGIGSLAPGEYQTVRAKIIRVKERPVFRRRGFRIFEAVAEDSTGRLSCVWFNQPYLKNYIMIDREVMLFGKVGLYGNSPQMQNPEYEVMSSRSSDGTEPNGQSKDSLNSARIIPVYSLIEGLSQRMFRRLIKTCLDEYLPGIIDILPYDIRQRNHLLNIASAVLNMHFPQDALRQEEAYKRIIFEECFLMQLIFGLKRYKADKITGIAHRLNEDFLKSFEEGLSFKLTDSQNKSITQIKKDMSSSKPMYRLLEGDVGCGKTIVALYGCMISVSNGAQAAFMAPTEILAQQHFRVISHQLSALSCQGRACKAGLLTSSVPLKEKQKIYNEIKNGTIDILVGTHALLQEEVEFKDLSLVVIDEQHKFGVYQRMGLLTKGLNPDCLIMTATPIPRTLALTIYSDLDISTIDELPSGRIPVKTYLAGEDRRGWVYDFIRQSLQSCRQAYIVYPIIDESEKLELKSAKAMYEDLKKNIFSDFKVGLIHGKMKQKERDKVMASFRKGEIDLLVSTVVIEVGIDVANASVMVIEHAERFGLSQLHQLRGRIGRGTHQSHCILISDSVSGESGQRLRVMVEESDGFKIAERDLEIRGPGEFFGTRQHGIPELRVNPLENMELLQAAKKEADALIKKDPRLGLRQNTGLADILKRRFPDCEKIVEAG